MQLKLVRKVVTGTEAAKAMAAKLVEMSAYFEFTPFPDDEYEFAVKTDIAQTLGFEANS